jgi:hypothetical protein
MADLANQLLRIRQDQNGWELVEGCPLDLDLEPPEEAVCRHPMDLPIP